MVVRLCEIDRVIALAQDFAEVAKASQTLPSHDAEKTLLELEFFDHAKGPSQEPTETTRVDSSMTQPYCCVTLPPFTQEGLLPAGIHKATWSEVVKRFGSTAHRRRLLEGLKAALKSLRASGCLKVYLDGSFVTAKLLPNDFDGCWDIEGVDPESLDPVWLTFDSGRAAQKAKFLGELFPGEFDEEATGLTFLEFFQIDKQTGTSKGIVVLDLRRWKS